MVIIVNNGSVPIHTYLPTYLLTYLHTCILAYLRASSQVIGYLREALLELELPLAWAPPYQVKLLRVKPLAPSTFFLNLYYIIFTCTSPLSFFPPPVFLFLLFSRIP